MRKAWGITLAFVLVLGGAGLVACGPSGDDDGDNNQNNNNYVPPDGMVNPNCEPFADDDGDFISNQDEGCEFNRDSDGDGMPDYVDSDSDNDGIADFIEAGDQNAQTPPRDSDGDGIPDYADRDSDNDGVPDNDEDRDGNGQVGECTTACDAQTPCPDPTTEYCSPTAGVCISVDCLNGETDPHSTDTDGDGIPDSGEPTFICNERSEDNPNGRKPIQRASHSSGIFQVALEQTASWLEVDPNNVGVNEAAASFSLVDPDHEMAGLAVARGATTGDVAAEAQAVIQSLNTISGVNATPLTSGNATTSHDGHDTVVSAVIQITTSSAVALGDLRNQIIAAVINHNIADFPLFESLLSSVTDTNFIFSFTTQRRDVNNLTIVVGGVATRTAYDSGEHVGYHVDDMANGTSLAEPSATTEVECESYLVESSPVADIVWVVDESGSMDDDQARVAAAGNTFLTVANQSGLDWRMCVVDMTQGNTLGCCTGTDQTGDQWLGPAQSAQFLQCIEDPAGSQTPSGGYEYGFTQAKAAIDQHLPRSGTDPHQIRPEAKLVVIFITDEPAQEYKDDCGIANSGSGWNATCDSMVVTDVAYFQGTEIDAMCHGVLVPGSTPDCSSQGGWGRGYEDVINQLGGTTGSICQSDLTATMSLIIQDIVGSASPVILEHTPISVSLAVAKEDKTTTPSTYVALPRSRVQGFDYRASANTIVFLQQDFSSPPYEVVVSYQRWVTGVAPPD